MEFYKEVGDPPLNFKIFLPQNQLFLKLKWCNDAEIKHLRLVFTQKIKFQFDIGEILTLSIFKM